MLVFSIIIMSSFVFNLAISIYFIGKFFNWSWLRKLEVNFLYLRQAIKIRKLPYLGQEVIYYSRLYMLNQGVAHPYWALSPVDKGARYLPRVHWYNFKPAKPVKSQVEAVRFHIRFLKSNWYTADIKRPVGAKIYYKHTLDPKSYKERQKALKSLRTENKE